MATDSQELYSILAGAVSSGMLLKAVFSGPAAAAGEIVRIQVRPLLLRGQHNLQIASRTATQEFHRNCDLAQALGQLRQFLDGRFRNLLLETPTEQLHAILNQRGTQWKLHRKPRKISLESSQKNKPGETIEAPKNQAPADLSLTTHDRQPQYLIPAGTPCPFLQATGVMDNAGNVRASHSRKFRQINRFLEFVKDLTDSLPSDRPLQVVDFGCGKSYLTFAVHHLLTAIQGRQCQITGLDRREDVVTTCREIARRLDLHDISFQPGTIASFNPDVPPDLVISLHACDTATDDALAQAVRWAAAGILAVPCCQQELQKRLEGSPLSPVTSWGIARERFCALATDTQRATLLEAAGYQTQLLEFIDMEHTPKNLLLRAVRVQSHRPERRLHELQALQQVTDFRQLLRIPPLSLERLLHESRLLPGSIPESAAAGRPV